jgi:phosphoglycerate dehydrogenase-like enzyme
VISASAPETADGSFLKAHLASAEIVVTSWDTAALDAEAMAAAPHLKLLVHAAGSVKPVVSETLWSRGVKVVSLAPAISYGVAEFCLGHILTAPKRIWWACEAERRGQWKEGLSSFGGVFEIYGQNIGIVGMGHVGKHLGRLLKSFACTVLAYDPYMNDEQAKELVVQKVRTIDEIFSRCRVVTLCAAGTKETRGMVKRRHFAALAPGSVFINVARGGIFDEQELVEELRQGRFVACLDVTDEEPTSPQHPYRSLPNVILTPHIAGVAAENRLRIGTMAADEIESYVQGRPLQFEVTREQLARIA